MRGRRKCKNINAPRSEKEIDERDDEIGEVHEGICSLEKDKILYYTYEKKRKRMRNKILRTIH